MKTRFFFVIYLHDDTIRTILDGMRIIADPSQKNYSHITVKGPYQNKQKKRLSQDNKLIQGKKIEVLGAGNFFIGSQNTVFLKCEEKPELFEIWRAKEEKTYKEFHPHITIYDGYDRIFAKKLFDTINKHNINFNFIVDQLDIYSSAYKTNLFNLRARVNYGFLTKIAGFNITEDNVDQLNVQQRISVIDKLCDILENKNHLFDDLIVNSNSLNTYGLLVDA